MMTDRSPQDHAQTRIIRPRAVKAVRPMMVPDDFAAECRNAGISEKTQQVLVQRSTEWHRRWVMQEESGHTMPHDVDDYLLDSSSEATEEEQEHHASWSANLDVLRLGAKNPSLSDGSVSGETLSESDEHHHPQSFVATPLLRPVALRPQDTAEMAPSPLNLPYEAESPSSPLTLPSGETYYGPQVFDDLSFESTLASIPSVIHPQHSPSISDKECVLHALAVSGGDVETPEFEESLIPLLRAYEETGWDARDPEGIYSNYANTRRVEGMWLTLSKPTYFGNLGETSGGDPMYTLGRMAFDMFLPTQLVCSLQGNFNPVGVIPPEERAALLTKCPKSLQDEILNGSSVLRKYNIVTAFTVEPHLADYPDAPNKDCRRPIKGIMTTHGYILPDPQVPNRLSIWFTGGRIEPNDDTCDQKEWKRLFNRGMPQRNFGERAKLFAANLLMGAEAPTTMNPDDGSMEFVFKRPLGGHGVAYVDVVYLDDSLRIVRGHRGTIFAFARIPENP